MIGRDRVLIAGGGIGGLAAALALARVGLGSQVLERREAFSEAGAGIQLGPNGMRLLRRLGVAERLEPYVVVPSHLDVFAGHTGRRLTALPLGGWMQRRFGAPYWITHRRDLHRALVEAAEAEPRIAIRTGFTVERIEEQCEGVVVTSAAGERVSGLALVGADGLWSRVAREAIGAPAPRSAGKSAFRTLLDMDVVPEPFISEMFSRQAVGLWLGEGAHLVTYPVRAGRMINVVAVIDDDWTGEGWNTADDGALVREQFSGWAGIVRGFLDGIGSWRKWTLKARSPLSHWAKGRIALLGDAAHPIFPFLAQGGVLAIEDAVALADVLAVCGGDVAGAFRRYELVRMARAARVVAASRRNGQIYHLTGPMRLARDLVLRVVPPGLMMRRTDWLYGYGQRESRDVGEPRDVAGAAGGVGA